MSSINKGLWCTALDCRTKAWFEARNRSIPDEAGRFRMEQGREVGELARQLFPDGHLVTRRDGRNAEDETQTLLGNESVTTLFEPAFVDGLLAARADILTREDGHWHLLEVKSSFSDKDDLKPLIIDVAYTAAVLRRKGIPIAQVSLLLLSRGYRKGDSVEKLFDAVDVTEKALAKAEEFIQMADGVVVEVLGEERPKAVLASACRDCDFFEDHCLGMGVKHTVLELPGLHYKKLNTLSAAGIVNLEQVPDSMELNDVQLRAKESALAETIFVSSGLGSSLNAVSWPCHYLDFETVATVLPLYNGGACHEQVVTQFSIHHKASPDADATHSEFLADPSKNCERELAEALIAALEDNGSIIVYSNFEEKRIRGLMAKFPDLEVKLQAILNRLVDLHPIVKENVYHPAFKGSFSIKNVLPALVPDLSYKGLTIGNGDEAIAMYARMARGELTGQDAKAIRQALLDYCKLDTFAMVRLHEVLSGSVVRTRVAGGE